MNHSDVVIVGAGPAGLFSVFQCGMLGLRTTVIDALESVGGQCTALYPEKPIYDIPAFERIDAADLIARLERQASSFQPRYLLGERVENLSLTSDGSSELQGVWALKTNKGTSMTAGAVILAAGGGAFEPNRPDLAGLARYEKNGSVSYVVKHREDFRGKRIVIAGGGDSAVDWALSLSEVASHVSIVHRRDRFRTSGESERRLRALAAQGEGFDLVVPYQLDGLSGDGGMLRAVRVRRADGVDYVKEIAADILLPFFGLDASPGPLARWNLAIDQGRFLRVDPSTCSTNLPGVFAIGDIANYAGKQRLILTAFSEAAVAAHAIHAWVRPGELLHIQHSTSRGAAVPQTVTSNGVKSADEVRKPAFAAS